MGGSPGLGAFDRGGGRRRRLRFVAERERLRRRGRRLGFLDRRFLQAGAGLVLEGLDDFRDRLLREGRIRLGVGGHQGVAVELGHAFEFAAHLPLLLCPGEFGPLAQLGQLGLSRDHGGVLLGPRGGGAELRHLLLADAVHVRNEFLEDRAVGRRPVRSGLGGGLRGEQRAGDQQQGEAGGLHLLEF